MNDEREMSMREKDGFTLIELMLAMTIIAIIFSIVRPKLSSASISSNENAAIAALRSITSAQVDLAASGAIDTDNDGVGEYGYFGELAGSAPLRIYNPVTESPTLGVTVLSPPLLAPAFRKSFFDGAGNNVVRVDGYFFKMFLPDVPILNNIRGVPETGAAGMGGATAGNFPYPDTCEALWCCYAWPEEVGVTGRRAFFINQEGRLLQTKNNGQPPGNPVYEGLALASLPVFDAAYSNEPGFPNGPTGMGALLGNPPRRANDGNVWTPIGR